MQVSKIIDKIRLDAPFSYHHPNPHNKSILIGAQAGELKSIFEEIYNLSVINSLITVIVGKPGTGKTQFLWNLEYRTNQHERDGVVLIYELKDKIPSYKDIIKFIHSHENFKLFARECGISFYSTSIGSEKKLASEVNNVIEKHGNVGMCIGVDGVDEYVRQLVETKGYDSKQAILDLLGTFRLVLDGVNKVCIIFALTKEVFTDMIPIISSDSTLRRRFLIANGIDGGTVEFGVFKENEAYTLVSTFIKSWAQRNEINIEHFVEANETWPFEKNAIKLAWRVGNTPGAISFSCMDSLLEKINIGISSIDEFNISELDIAKNLLKNKSYSRYEVGEIWNEIDFIVNEPAINEKIDFLKVQAEKETGGQLDTLLKYAFEKYLSDLGFSIKYGNSDVIAGRDYEDFSRVVAIKFIDGLTITKKDCQDLANDLFSLKNAAGLFICIVNQNLSNKTLQNKIKYPDKYELIFKSLESRIDYNSTLLLLQINRDDLFKIIGLQKLEDPERGKLVKIIDRELKIKPLLESLMFTEPSKIPKSDNNV